MRIPVSAHSLTLGDGRTVTLHELIGRGSLGSVYRGVVEGAFGVRRPVAIKLFDVHRDDDNQELFHQLVATARRAACVQHDGVVQTFEIDRTDGRQQAFVVMELVEGEPLGALLASWRYEGERVPLDFALVVAVRVAEAVGAALFAEANEGGVTALVHGDLSPRQILVSSRGQVKVSDFGQGTLRDLASRVRSRDRLAFTAPEVACGYGPDPRADVFSLGLILHEMLVGPRFGSGTATEDVFAMVRDGVVPTSCMDPVLPNGIREVLDRALATDAADRQLHAQALATELRREMFRLNLVDTQTCVRHAVVGWCEAPIAERTVRVSEIALEDEALHEAAPDTDRGGARRVG